MRLVISAAVLALGLSATAALADSIPGSTPAAPPTATTAPADTKPATAPTDAKPAQDNDDVVSCRYEKTTGSLFARRVCHTQREWHQMNVNATDFMNNLDRGTNGDGHGGGG
jgi:hypothetical protein